MLFVLIYFLIGSLIALIFDKMIDSVSEDEDYLLISLTYFIIITVWPYFIIKSIYYGYKERKNAETSNKRDNDI